MVGSAMNDTKHTEAASRPEGSSGNFFRKLDWSAFWTACALAFVVYLCTLAPTVSLEDSGELAVAGDYLGVPHPPGYPIWTMLAWVFTKFFAFVRFRGQPNPAWSIGLLSAVFGSLATGITAMLICRSGSDLLRASWRASHKSESSTEDLICWAGGVVGSLLFAFSPVMWSQSVIVEVYSLNAFFLVLIFLLTYRWMCRPSEKLLYITAFVFGLGLTNYQVLLLAALPLVIVIVLKDIELFRDFLIVGAPFALGLLLIKRWQGLPGPHPNVDSLGEILKAFVTKGALPPISHLTHATMYFYTVLNFVILISAFFFLPRGRTVALTVLMAELGVAFYVYMPIVSDLRNPPMNWAYPRTWEGFKHAITRGQYEKIKPADALSIRFVHQIGSYLSDLRMQFTLLAAPLGLLPFTAWSIKAAGRRINAMYVAIVLTILAVMIAMAEKYILPAGEILTAGYKLIFCGVLVILATGVLAIFISQARELFLKLSGKTGATVSERITVSMVFLSVLILFLFYMVMLGGKIVAITEPLRKAGETITSDQLGQIVLQGFGLLLLIVTPAVLCCLVAWMMRSRCEFRMSMDGNSQKWVIATLAGFLAMSIMLIVLANPKGDIQDNFIQRVKFISSHALYAFWIGYGLIFGLAFIETLFRGRRSIRRLSVTAAMILPLVPIHQNIYNRELVRLYGGAEQSGHDFGWQFGNYQLRGSGAISEELDPDEEPLPNPEFPPEMGQDAIFFGGTDPGRFVPTYMIYSARVREDVYLITQNALADNTYLSVMRDLYGDQIWIPAQVDSGKAFQRYVEEVRAGKRPRNANLKIENGRVQVSGALGVMEINGILAHMIFEHNNYKHAFYVEESYVIRWMYPYLEPHGLIMKINRKKTQLSDETMRNDSDFWDWYTRRLMSNPKFPRDIVARKSFSKLRSAIGGAYSKAHKLRNAEEAFQQARILYPLSPEANFRLCQEVYMKQQRFSEAKELAHDFAQRDPGNTKAPGFRNQIEKVEDMFRKIGEHEAQMAKRKLDVNKALELADLYRQSGQINRFMRLTEGIVGNTNLPPFFAFRAAQLLLKAKKTAQTVSALDRCIARLPPSVPPNILLQITKMYGMANQPQKMKKPLEMYLKQKPGDWKGWLDLASLHISLKENEGATKALGHAVKAGGNEAVSAIKGNRHFDSVRNAAMQRSRSLIGIPESKLRR